MPPYAAKPDSLFEFKSLRISLHFLHISLNFCACFYGFWVIRVIMPGLRVQAAENTIVLSDLKKKQYKTNKKKTRQNKNNLADFRIRRLLQQ